MDTIISPSILSSDFTQLAREVEMLDKSQADWVHIDVMDGVFVPNISFGFPIIKQIRRLTQKPFDVHLMIVEPDRYFEEFRRSGADILSIHYENNPHLHRSVERIKTLGMKAGIVLNPQTPVAVLEDLIHYLDLVLIMSVNPGYGGQSFIDNTTNKIRKLSTMIEMQNADALIEVDGGIGLQNASSVIDAGADILVAGNSVFASNDPPGIIAKLKKSKNSIT